VYCVEILPYPGVVSGEENRGPYLLILLARQGVSESDGTRPLACPHWRCLVQHYGIGEEWVVTGRVFNLASAALQTFEHAIQDAVDLLSHFDALNKKPPPPEIEVLKRASLVMALAALETYFEDLLVESVDALCGQSNADGRLTDFFRMSLEHDLKTFHTPSTDRVRPIFKKYLGYDVTEGWSWNNCDPAKARAELNRLSKKRGDIAHRSWRPLPGQPTPHAVTRDAMRKHIHFIKELAKATDACVQARC